ncbi:HIT domain protein [Pseudovibrio axinellae]|uniref:HIT domain protein n=1 Tax=Pseudovibrio axinellae TaxID=989403 RepID=A0A166ABL1_9HYPH|nr:HIT domain protein [Pseudovibrio axinellae]SER21179.1 histidine triad (HIT) family protein [Pseudovibrio axinellae]
MKPDATVFENESVIAFFDRGSISPYHTLVVPKRHSTNIFDVQEDDLIKLTCAIREICLIYKEKLNINNIQIVSSNGAEAQQDAFHLHFHIVPRSKGDGQDIEWTPDPTLPGRFQSLLSKLKAK